MPSCGSPRARRATPTPDWRAMARANPTTGLESPCAVDMQVYLDATKTDKPARILTSYWRHADPNSTLQYNVTVSHVDLSPEARGHLIDEYDSVTVTTVLAMLRRLVYDKGINKSEFKTGNVAIDGRSNHRAGKRNTSKRERRLRAAQRCGSDIMTVYCGKP